MILVITNERIGGLQYHRQIIPFKYLGLEVEFQISVDELTDEYLKKFKIISFLREIKGDPERYKKLGLIIHFDIDDYWVLPANHELYKEYKLKNAEKDSIKFIQNADFVTTTTNYLAERIKKINKNVYVLSNAIDPSEEQWIPNHIKTTHNRIRFGYIAGVHHTADVEMLHKELLKLWRDLSIKDKWQLITGGFNFNQYANSEIVANPYYRHVEHCFTSSHGIAYNFLKKEKSWQLINYANILSSDQLIDCHDVNMPYMRLNGRDINNYGKLYDEIDVSLVPLISSEFNRNKSQLKMIEAGFKRKAVIVSNVIPYRLDFTGHNVLSCENDEWYKKIKYLIENPNKIIDLQESLYEYVNSRYRIDIVNIERRQIFESWLK